MKNLFSHFTLLAVCSVLLFCSCQKEQQNSSEKPTTPDGANISQTRIREQLDSTINLWNAAARIDLKLAGYEFLEGTITNQELSNARAKFLNEDNLIPYYDGINESSYTLSSIRQRTEAARVAGESAEKDLRVKIGQAVDTLVQAGQGLVQLHWTSQGKKFSTLAAYDAKGLVYDNMLVNLFVVEENPSSLEEASNLKVTTTKRTVVDLTIKWVWGGKRGWVLIEHTIYKENGKVIKNGGSAQASMTLGDAAARAQSFKYTAKYGELTWAYGWGTVKADINFSYTGKPAKIGVTVKNVGSSGKGNGLHVITY
jgi:hypothetical protein